MKYFDLSIYLNRNYRLTDSFTKNIIMQLGLKSYEVNHLHRDGYSYTDIAILACKFNDKAAFCDFVRKYLLKNCWWD